MLLVVSLALSCAQTPAEDGIRVLFVGNSFTYHNDVPGIFEQLGSGRGVSTDSRAPGGYTLEQHAADKKTRQLIDGGAWDYVVLQEQSTRPIHDVERMLAAARELHQAIDAVGAKTVLFVTWPRSDRPQDGSKLAEAYRRVGRELEVLVVPVGEAWAAALKARPDLELHDPDGLHASPAGSYLTACALWAALGETKHPAPSARVAGVSSDDAEFLCEMAARAAGS